MAENTYEYECMRAELLGIEKPNYDDWLKKQQEQKKINGDVDDEDTIINENLKSADAAGDGLGRISGGLDELNGILQITQRKINRFKASCGSLTNLLKFRTSNNSTTVNSAGTASSQQLNNDDDDDDDVNVTTSAPCTPKLQQNHSDSDNKASDQRKSDLAKALDNHVDCIDAMLEKAENAQYSMAYQNKEMKRFLR